MEYGNIHSGNKTFNSMKIKFLFDSDCEIGKIICIIIYLFIYDYLFYTFVYGLFAYLGEIEYMPMDIATKSTWLFLSIIPFAFYKHISNVSSFITLFLYIFAYIPFIHAIFVLWKLPIQDKLLYTIVTCVFFSIYISMGKGRKLLKDIRIIPEIQFRWLEMATIALTIVFVLANYQRMHFVNIFTQESIMYELRAQNSEDMGVRNIFGYLRGWLFGAFYPFLLICYLKQKKWLKALLILGGYIILFMVDMQKLTFLMPFALMGLYFLIKSNMQLISHYLHSYIIIFFAISSLILLPLQDNKVLFTMSAIIILRTVCVTGWLTQMYFNFFINGNPFTHFSHINIINFFTNAYPYNESLGQIVAYNSQNANATFLLTDGYAAWGLIGIIIIGIIFFIFLEFLNSVTYRYKTEDLFILFLPTTAYLLNTSFFTTLLSNGLFILLIFIAMSNNPLLLEKNASS